MSSERANDERMGDDGKDIDIVTCLLFLGLEREEGMMEAEVLMPVKVVKVNEVP